MSIELTPAAWGRDVDGFAVFCHGDAGAAHAMAHRLLDEGKHALGHRLLGAWLEPRTGSGSQWCHLHWHMAVFEIAVAEWDAAFDRFEREIMPLALRSDEALTDAPAMLWRLSLSSPHDVPLPWASLRPMAIRNLGKNESPFVEAHCLLLLAGCGDVEAIDHWLRCHVRRESLQDRTLVQLAQALRAVAAEDYATASFSFESIGHRMGALGGSHAQRLLFEEIRSYSSCRATERRAA